MRILVADDDPTSRAVLRAMVSKLGHECLLADDGASAWQRLSAGGIDVLLTDWMMPGLDGPGLCRRVRDEFSAQYVYIVLITGLGHPEQVLEGMSAGADDYLIKPVDAFTLQTRLIAAHRVTALQRQVAEIQSELERANLELLGRSLTDPLTGLGNRRRMEEELAGTHAEAMRSRRAYAVSLFDIDHFKLYNDHYGHLAGDEALRSVARCLGACTRTGESVYRYGGEEFLILLRDCDATAATAAASRLCQAVTARAIPHETRPTTPPFLTVSGGVAHWSPHEPVTVEELLLQADAALFKAKSVGRNQVHTARAVAIAAAVPVASG